MCDVCVSVLCVCCVYTIGELHFSSSVVQYLLFGTGSLTNWTTLIELARLACKLQGSPCLSIPTAEKDDSTQIFFYTGSMTVKLWSSCRVGTLPTLSLGIAF